jgi:hypothetical protein
MGVEIRYRGIVRYKALVGLPAAELDFTTSPQLDIAAVVAVASSAGLLVLRSASAMARGSRADLSPLRRPRGETPCRTGAGHELPLAVGGSMLRCRGPWGFDVDMAFTYS